MRSSPINNAIAKVNQSQPIQNPNKKKSILSFFTNKNVNNWAGLKAEITKIAIEYSNECNRKGEQPIPDAFQKQTLKKIDKIIDEEINKKLDSNYNKELTDLKKKLHEGNNFVQWAHDQAAEKRSAFKQRR